jgi:hypothetical protein
MGIECDSARPAAARLVGRIQRFAVSAKLQLCGFEHAHCVALYRPTRPTLKRVSDSRAMQFWDKGHLIAAQVKQQLERFHSIG